MKDKVAYIFPGQGAQFVGMGEDFYQRSPQARKIFEQANDILKFDLAALMFTGPLDELTRTVNCQVAVFTASIAYLRAFQSINPPIEVKYTAGLSLGEYTALVAAGAVTFEDALRLVKARARYMDEAGRQNSGGMISIIGLSLETVEEICKKADVEIANLNCPGQIVISGRLSALKKAEELALTSGAKRAIQLKVSGAFHSSLMAEAGQKLSKILEEIDIHSPEIPVISNVTAREEYSPQKIKDNLVRQISSRTLWEDSIRFISVQGIKRFLEIGPGAVLKGLLRKIDARLTVYNIGTFEDLERFREEKIGCY